MELQCACVHGPAAIEPNGPSSMMVDTEALQPWKGDPVKAEVCTVQLHGSSASFKRPPGSSNAFIGLHWGVLEGTLNDFACYFGASHQAQKG